MLPERGTEGFKLSKSEIIGKLFVELVHFQKMNFHFRDTYSNQQILDIDAFYIQLYQLFFHHISLNFL